ncbi:hypothetical protein P691DRAFT_442954 [Macrolepiota fuliginosa MF-IS2]|uniref:Nephrocystin 3-like N-terminal domain-containing protein n=1 Tax=Macrolepiota fuliginosa MF-IS2 TaxID=1400762 RepID=A0A9P5XNU8_9AGAR|nr:hypothetical protein P691DRAFT_442954 [Macrolepiota fuliginosa MF-IS2]
MRVTTTALFAQACRYSTIGHQRLNNVLMFGSSLPPLLHQASCTSSIPRLVPPDMNMSRPPVPASAPKRFIVPIQKQQDLESGRRALTHLDTKRASDAVVGLDEYNDRRQLPKCHPGTHKDLWERITDWRTKRNEEKMFWILGTVGVGKSTVAQAVAEECRATGTLFAAFFFPRFDPCDIRRCLIPTLAFQFATQRPDYKQLVINSLAENPNLLSEDLCSQFTKLIARPLRILKVHGVFGSRESLAVVIIDGPDSCQDIEAQHEFTKLLRFINDRSGNNSELPILCMICSRPESYLKTLFFGFDNCIRKELLVDDDNAKNDVGRFLLNGFAEIRQRFPESFDNKNEEWPLPDDSQRLHKEALGHFAFASIVLNYVGDVKKHDPRNRLTTCLRSISTTSPKVENPSTNSPRSIIASPKVENPFRALYKHYDTILSTVPKHSLDARRILGFCALYPGNGLSTSDIGNFLGLDGNTFYSAVEKLHSVLAIPKSPDTIAGIVQFYNTSFPRFLLHSQEFTKDLPEIHADIAIRAIKWYNLWIEKDCILEDKSMCSFDPPQATWELSTLDKVGPFSAGICWEACCRVSGPNVTRILEALSTFNFCHLTQENSRDARGLTKLINWLFSVSVDTYSVALLV